MTSNRRGRQGSHLLDTALSATLSHLAQLDPESIHHLITALDCTRHLLLLLRETGWDRVLIHRLIAWWQHRWRERDAE